MDAKLNDHDTIECLAVANSGWLSCQRPLTFSKADGKKFVNMVKKVKRNKPFNVIAELRDENRNLTINMECTAPGIIMVSGKFVERSEFEQEATFGFNIEKPWVNEFLKQMEVMLAKRQLTKK